MDIHLKDGILQQVGSQELMGQVYGFISINDQGCVIKNCKAHIEHIGGGLGRGAGFAATNSGVIQECSASGYVKTGIFNYNEGSGFCNTNVGRIESCYTTVDVYSNHIDGYVASFVFNNGGSRIEYSQLLEDAQGVIINCLALGHCFILNKDHNKQPYTFLHATNNVVRLNVAIVQIRLILFKVLYFMILYILVVEILHKHWHYSF